ncbi:MAG TPA: MarR family transcriptional regulator [Bryobacteraceae bacterium]|nr:MarR family transcriptional regulator [Bryobacteraceae bacterium]
MPSHYEGRQDTVRALNAYINLARAADSLLGRMSLELDEKGLTMGQFGALETLLHLGPMCQRTLGHKLLRSRGNITLVVDNLEKHGWVRRKPQKDDRRMIVIHLTPQGRRLIESVFPEHAQTIKREMSVLTQREQESLRRICRKLGRDGEGSREQRRKKEKQNDTGSTK